MSSNPLIHLGFYAKIGVEFWSRLQFYIIFGVDSNLGLPPISPETLLMARASNMAKTTERAYRHDLSGKSSSFGVIRG